MMLSIEEADTFLLHQLKFENWREILKNDKLKFLQLLVPYYSHNIYFQNISLSSIPDELRRVPNAADIIQAGLNGVGGNCITQNTFVMFLLKALGFDAYIVSGMVKGPGHLPNNHVMCVVRFSADELYLLDMGVGLPFAEPIPLHNLPYTNRAVGFRYVYRKTVNGVYERVQLDGALFGEEFEENGEYIRYDFTLEPRTIEYFTQPLTDIFTNPEKSIFLQDLLLFRYFNENEYGEMCSEARVTGDRKFIIVRGLTILIGSDATKELKHFANYGDMKEVIFKYFPRMRKDEVEKSIKNFYKYSNCE